jgi:small subunit ribosomal protein S16
VAVKLRLMRMGKTKQPTYRIVAADSHNARDGRFIEILGTYEPRKEPSLVNLNADKVFEYIATGAQPTERVGKILSFHEDTKARWAVVTAARAVKVAKAKAANNARPTK